MLCVIPHICRDAKDHSNIDQRKQVNNVIKTLFHGVPEDEISFTQNMFWTEYTDFDSKNDSFDWDAFIWKSKYIRDDYSHSWHKK